ncbi:hypothetical protein O3M35_008230 [Rhynocoris fuscipes]|uniref:Uncharacterized protein n=1 Tax=Rhynocoris fuscipes TaxID=488301 RepID=A0AAW1D6B3_9HEMI
MKHELFNLFFFQRSVDPIYRIYEKGLTLADNATEIALSEEECQRRLKLEDNEVQDIFGGYLERFQWKTTAAYYMCYFTLQDNPDLSLFGEPCDNFANCVARENGNSDPRADDSKPYYCALYR